ncbi:hypothetical protein [Dictyobacter arantiisoli]|uniref:PhoD-like phosphatase metallophosphatase domain-containing protein n=1 Tax=Dictyobacter arantiisoli TaxID=2014874 RepID=A0A5A5T693_9CHLR|nr:hypothetical protein [Dictyobacter arantiisoli]GCF06706.1 hypothetical protein KDI_02700 [Dictyobacter arantiisoli]
MSWISLSERITQLPLILAGPIVRRVDPESVTVWLALKSARNVTLRIYERASQDDLQLRLQATQTTLRIGDNLHMIAITAKVAKQQEPLDWQMLYYYNLFFSPADQIPDAQALQAETIDHLGTPGILNKQKDPLQQIVYPGHPLPSFLLPAQDIQQFRIVHGSCRKAHGAGKEMLSGLDIIIAQAVAQGGQERPQQLYMTGDQIYADDVATPLLHTLTDAGNVLLAGNQREILPQIQLAADKLLPGTRKHSIENQAHFTTSKPQNHLMAWGEYLAMYLFSWSDVLWPAEMLSIDEFWAWLYPGVHADHGSQLKAQDQYRDELQKLASFREALPQVRRALANIATYMICDDHDVTDDWFLDGDWCHHVLQKPLGRRIIRNALLAYALCQAWGNTPAQFAESHGAALLEAINDWRGNEGSSQADIIWKAIGMPEAFKGKGALQRSKRALDWHYHYAGPNYQVIVLDTRTQRYYESPGSFPGLLTRSAMQQQIEQIKKPEAEATIIISAAPVIGIDFIETVQFWSRWRVKDNYKFDREAWSLEWGTFQHFLQITSTLKHVVFLTGDVHYAFASSLEYWDQKKQQTARFVNFTASPYCNEGSGAQISVLAVGYPRLRALLQGGEEPILDFFAWDITGNDHYTLTYFLTLIRKQLYRFWWAIPRLIAARRARSEIIMPANGWLKGAFDHLPPSRSYRIHYLRNTLQTTADQEHRPHISLMRFTLRPLRGILRGLTRVQTRTRRTRSKLQERSQRYTPDQTQHAWNRSGQQLLGTTIEQAAKIEQRLERPKTGLANTLSQYEKWLGRWKAGNLIVGYNNLGEISFAWNQEQQEVRQRLWWHNPEHPKQLQSTLYRDTLKLPALADEPPLP